VEDLIRELFEAIVKWLEGNEGWIKPVSYVASPILAGLAFWANLRNHRRLQAKGFKLGHLKAEVKDVRREVERRTHQLREEQARVRTREARIQSLEDDLRRITEGSNQLWKLRPNNPFPDYRHWHDRGRGAKIITVGHLKGGVGKTTIAANMAAYISTTLRRPVLLVDLDYQGSLSNGLMLAAEQPEVSSNVDRLFEDDASLITLDRARVHLTPAMDRGWLVPASYPFAATENRLLMQWILQETANVDVRYRLAHALLRPEVRDGYAAIILDMPPRMTMGAVNALIASHFVLVPTILDKLSAEAVAQFLTQLKGIKSDLGLELELAGVVATLTHKRDLVPREIDALALVKAGVEEWDAKRNYIIRQHLPRRANIAAAAGETIAYNLAGADGQDLRSFFDPIFDEVLTRIGVIEKASSGPEV
jgi:chromosome partitioning protein